MTITSGVNPATHRRGTAGVVTISAGSHQSFLGDNMAVLKGLPSPVRIRILRLPVTIAVATTVIDPVGIAVAVRGAGQSRNLELHQTLRGKANCPRTKQGCARRWAGRTGATRFTFNRREGWRGYLW
jgi:hypothetical protein